MKEIKMIKQRQKISTKTKKKREENTKLKTRSQLFKRKIKTIEIGYKKIGKKTQEK